MNNDVIVGLGSNIQPATNIEKAVTIIKNKFLDIDRSCIIETEPIGFIGQDNFYNGALRFKTKLRLKALKQWLLDVEHRLGRVRTENKNSPRTIDLDILVWNGEIIDEDVYIRTFLQTAIEELWPGLIQSEMIKKD